MLSDIVESSVEAEKDTTKMPNNKEFRVIQEQIRFMTHQFDEFRLKISKQYVDLSRHKINRIMRT